MVPFNDKRRKFETLTTANFKLAIHSARIL